MEKDKRYIINYYDLKEGSYSYFFEIEEDFLKEYEYLEASGGRVEVKIEMYKYKSYISFLIKMKGFLILKCDRCLVEYKQEIEFNDEFVVKFSKNPSKEEEEMNVVFKHIDDKEIDLKHYFFENISLSIPYRRVHPDLNGVSTCNKDMLKYIINANNDIFDY